MNYGLMGIYILVLMDLLISANKHGKISDEPKNFGLSLIGAIIYLTLVWCALGWRFYP